MNKDYRHSTIEDLIWDEGFRSWVLHPDPERDQYWESWLAEHPEKKELAACAAEVVKALKTDAPGYEHADRQAPVDELFRRLNRGRQAGGMLKKLHPALGWVAAAAVILVVGILLITTNRKSLLNIAQVGHADSLVTFYNSTNNTQLITLPDNSKISLDKNSGIRISTLFKTLKERKVYLTGNAFFDVAKDKTRPFYVYTGNITIRVVGTSFKVLSNHTTGKVSVDVLSGVVKVSSLTEKGPTKKVEEVTLTRNQRVAIEKAKEPDVGIVENPVVSENEFISFNYDETPVYTILADLERGYGVKILYNKDEVPNKAFSGNIEGKSLSEKLFILCKTLGYKYRIADGSILVFSGNGER
ncbi:FecR family protein [Niabella aurantiaca]|uniref:FecR family protein n=1 Tax=Niabella aurantiaca TaxID=379900 RepID=UPI0003A682C5|nr:FecR family protein [Niabella aurantiaca]